jgi:NAD(P)-dependent dehydrogenase (short-subunit alcohol dehydrogenase family)
LRRSSSTVRNEYGLLDILINNAGIGHVGTIEATAGTDLDRLYAVNVRGVFAVVGLTKSLAIEYSCKRAFTKGVSTRPGQTQLTRIPCVA